MNTRLKDIFSRRSVRAYKEKPVGEDLIKDILEAGMAAPSAVAKDPWHFIVVTNKQTLSDIAKALPNGQMLPDAPLGIVVCGDIDKAHGNELSYMLQDCSAAIENMLLAISMLGLGACWLGVHPREERIAHIKSLFSLPEHIIPLSVLAVGYPAEFPAPRTRYKEEAVHREKW